jgi:PilZ domain
MNHRPVSLSVLGYGLVLAAIIILLAAYIASHESAATGLSANLTLVGFAALLSFAGSWYSLAASSWFLALVPLIFGINLSAIYAVMAAVSASSKPSLSLYLLLLGLGLSIVSLFMLFDPKGRKVLLNPATRWWRQAKRVTAKVPITLNAGDVVYDLVSHDLSQTGIFVTGALTDAPLLPALVSHVERRDPVEILIKAGDNRTLLIDGEIARIQNHADGNYPIGLGIRFMGLTWRKRLSLLSIIRALKSTDRGGH